MQNNKWTKRKHNGAYMKKKILRLTLIILILLWMKIVFGFSSDNAETSSGLSMKVAKFFTKNEEILVVLEPIIRKLAHLSEYAVRRNIILWIVFNI